MSKSYAVEELDACPTVDLINKLIEKTRLEDLLVRKLKRLSIKELEALIVAFDKNEMTIDDLQMDLKPENYLTSRELGDRMMADQIMGHIDYFWRKITGQPELPMNFIGFMFALVIYALFIAVFFGIIVLPILWLIGAWGYG